MPARAESLGDRIKESLRFWTVVAVVCGLVFFGGYVFGKEWLGARLHEVEVSQGAPEISPEASLTEASEDESPEPPDKPVVVMEEREPSGRERREAEREVAAHEPQDGAQLHAVQQEQEKPPAEEAEERPASEPTGPATTGGFVVTAGSFADEGNARRVVRELSARGYQPYLTTVRTEGMTFRRVNVAVYARRADAEELQAKLTAEGYESAVWPQ